MDPDKGFLDVSEEKKKQKNMTFFLSGEKKEREKEKSQF